MKYIKITLTEKQKHELNHVEKDIKNIRLLKRIQCVKLKDAGWTNIKIAEFLQVCHDTITDWLQAYVKHGIDGVLNWEYRGRPPLLTETQLETIRQRNHERPFDHAAEAVQFIETRFGITYHVSWVQKLLKKNWDCHTKKQH